MDYDSVKTVQASFEKQGEVTYIILRGRLDFRDNAIIQKKIQDLLALKKKKNRIIIDIQHLNFVGSIGVKDLVLLFRKLNYVSPRPRFVGLNPEFTVLFKAFEGRKKFFVYRDRQTAINSFDA